MSRVDKITELESRVVVAMNWTVGGGKGGRMGVTDNRYRSFDWG